MKFRFIKYIVFRKKKTQAEKRGTVLKTWTKRGDLRGRKSVLDTELNTENSRDHYSDDQYDAYIALSVPERINRAAREMFRTSVGHERSRSRTGPNDPQDATDSLDRNMDGLKSYHYSVRCQTGGR